MSLTYLWKDRVKPHFFSKHWIKVWAKRILNSNGLLTILWRRKKYSIYGAKIGDLSILENIDLNGPATRLSVGERSFLASGVHLALHEQIVIGDRVVINSGVHLLTASHDIADPGWQLQSKPIIIKDYAWIATNAIILPGVTIGKGSVVGAGAVVSRNVPDFTVVAGNPARPLRQRNIELFYSPVDLCAPFEAWLGKK